MQYSVRQAVQTGFKAELLLEPAFVMFRTYFYEIKILYYVKLFKLLEESYFLYFKVIPNE